VGCPVKRSLVLAAFAAAASLSACGAYDAPLAPASAGKFLCVDPDVHDKSCQATIVFSRDLFGHIVSRLNETVRISAAQVPIVVELKAPVTIENGQVCSVMTADIIKTMTMRRNDMEMPGRIEEASRAKSVDLSSAMLGKKACTAFTAVGDNFIQLTSTLDGGPSPDGNHYALWSGKADGYFLDAR
jgi:hypothetical protein